MKITFTLIIIFISSTITFAQKFTYNTGSVSNKNYYEEIPYEDVAGKFYIQVDVAGKKHKFFFDTGAPTQITPEFSKELNPTLIKRDVVVDATGKKDSLNIVAIAGIQLNSIQFNNVAAL